MELMTVNQVAEFFKVSRVTVYKWLNADMLPSCRVNGKLRFIKSDLENLVEESSKNIVPRPAKIA